MDSVCCIGAHEETWTQAEIQIDRPLGCSSICVADNDKEGEGNKIAEDRAE